MANIVTTSKHHNNLTVAKEADISTPASLNCNAIKLFDLLQHV